MSASVDKYWNYLISYSEDSNPFQKLDENIVLFIFDKAFMTEQINYNRTNIHFLRTASLKK